MKSFFNQICADTSKSTTFDEIRKLTIRAAKNLRNFGCRKGQVILISTKNTADVVPLIFAALCLGCPVTPVHPYNTRVEYLYHLNLTKPEIVFIDLDLHSMLKECFDELEIRAKYFTFGGETVGTHSINCLFEEVDDDSSFE